MSSLTKTAAFTIGPARVALEGTYPEGVTFLNASPEGGPTIVIGNAEVTLANGFPLRPGAALDRGWRELGHVHAVATGEGADLRVVSL
jgi:hypothetical protein